jgi:ABC-2 type transport system ATP-binding protein
VIIILRGYFLFARNIARRYSIGDMGVTSGNKDIVVVENLVKKYGQKTVVNRINFTVKAGEIFGILGPNGAGKTTTLEMLETMREIDGGSAMLAGLDVSKNKEKVKAIIGVQPQTPNFEEKTKLFELLEFYASTYGEKIDPLKLLKSVQLEEKAQSYPEQLSGGQRQRFSIAVALVHGPKVFFLDEPTTGLDPQARRNLWQLVQEVRDKGITVIMTTHYMDEAELLCDRVAVMDDGNIIALDTPKNLIKNLLKKGFKKTQQVEQANLEDVFIDLTGKALRE